MLNAVENAMDGNFEPSPQVTKRAEKPAKKRPKVVSPPKLGVHLRASTKSIVAQSEAQRKELREIREMNVCY